MRSIDSVSDKNGSSKYHFPFTTCAEVSSPEDTAANRRVFTGYAPASSFLEIDDAENVREYMLDAPGRQRLKPTVVHQKIRDTLLNETDKFSILNSGITIVTKGARFGRGTDYLHLEHPSIINGSQTRGELRRYVTAAMNSDVKLSIPNVFFQIIVTTDDELVAEVSIARNFQNDVKPISIVGRLGHLDDLEKSLLSYNKAWKLRMSETDLAEGGYVDTEKLIQVMFALMPAELAARFTDKDGITNKVFTYTQRTKCLRMFQYILENPKDDNNKAVYRYFLDIAPQAWELYLQWKAHPGFKGSGIHAIERDGMEVVEVPDGIIFPIIASLATFVKVSKKDNQWVLAVPSRLDVDELISAAKQAYQEIARRNPQAMGKSKACYSSLARVTNIYSKLSERQ